MGLPANQVGVGRVTWSNFLGHLDRADCLGPSGRSIQAPGAGS